MWYQLISFQLISFLLLFFIASPISTLSPQLFLKSSQSSSFISNPSASAPHNRSSDLSDSEEVKITLHHELDVSSTDFMSMPFSEDDLEEDDDISFGSRRQLVPHKTSSFNLILVLMGIFFFFIFFIQVFSILQSLVGLLLGVTKKMMTISPTGVPPSQFTTDEGFSHYNVIFESKDVSFIIDSNHSSIQWDETERLLVIPLGESLDIYVEGQSHTLTAGSYLFERSPIVYHNYDIKVDYTLPSVFTPVSSDHITVYSYQPIRVDDYHITDGQIIFNQPVYQSLNDMTIDNSTQSISLASLPHSWHAYHVSLPADTPLNSTYQIYGQNHDIHMNTDTLGQISFTSEAPFYLERAPNQWIPSSLNHNNLYEVVLSYPFKQELRIELTLPNQQETIVSSFFVYADQMLTEADYSFANESSTLSFNQTVYRTDAQGTFADAEKGTSFHVSNTIQAYQFGDTTVQAFSLGSLVADYLSPQQFKISSDLPLFIKHSHEPSWTLSPNNTHIETLPTKSPLTPIQMEQPISALLSGQNAICVSQDGTTLMTQSPHNYDIYVYEKNQGQWLETPSFVLTGNTTDLIDLQLSPDQTKLVSITNDSLLRIWTRTDQGWNSTTTAILSGHTDTIETLAWSPDGQALFSGSADHSIKVWTQTDGAWNATASQTLTGHTNSVVQLVLSSDGQTLFSGSLDHSIKIWTQTDGIWNATASQTLTGHTNSVVQLVLSSDGQTLFSGSADHSIKIWTQTDGTWNSTATQTLEGHDGIIIHLRLSSDGQELFATDFDLDSNIITVWTQTETGWNETQTYNLGEHSHFISQLLIVHDDNTLFSSSYDGSVLIWQKENGLWNEQATTSLQYKDEKFGNLVPVLNSQISDQELFTLMSYNTDKIIVWNLEPDGQALTQYQSVSFTDPPSVNLSFNSVDWNFSQDGQFLKIDIDNEETIHNSSFFTLQSDQETLHLTNVDGQFVIHTPSNTEYHFQALSENGVDWFDTFFNFDTTSDDPFSLTFVYQKGETYVVTEQYEYYRIVPFNTDQTFKDYLAHTDWNQVNYNQNLTVSLERKPSPFSIQKNNDSISFVEKTLEGENAFLLSENGQTLVTESLNGHDIYIYQKVNGEWPDTPIATLSGHSAPLYGFKLSSDQSHLYSYADDGTIRVWTQTDGVWNSTASSVLSGHGEGVRNIILSSDENTLFSASEDHSIKIWTKTNDTWNTTPSQTLSGSTHENPNMRLSSDNNTLVATSETGHDIYVWTRTNDTWSPSPTTTLTGHTGFVSDIIFSSDGHTIFSSSWDSTIRIWTKTNDVWNSSATHTLSEHTHIITDIELSSDELELFSGSWDSTVKLWTKTDGVWNSQPSLNFPKDISLALNVKLTPDNQKLLAMDSNKLVIWKRNSDYSWSPDATDVVYSSIDPLLSFQTFQTNNSSFVLLNQDGHLILSSFDKLDELVAEYGHVPNTASTLVEARLLVSTQWTSSQEGVYLQWDTLDQYFDSQTLMQLKTTGNEYIALKIHPGYGKLFFKSHVGDYSFQRLENGSWHNTFVDPHGLSRFSIVVLEEQTYFLSGDGTYYRLVPDAVSSPFRQPASISFASLLQSQSWSVASWPRDGSIEIIQTPQLLNTEFTNHEIQVTGAVTSSQVVDSPPSSVHIQPTSLDTRVSLSFQDSSDSSVYFFRNATLQQSFSSYQSKNWIVLLGVGIGLFFLLLPVEIILGYLFFKKFKKRRRTALSSVDLTYFRCHRSNPLWSDEDRNLTPSYRFDNTPTPLSRLHVLQEKSVKNNIYESLVGYSKTSRHFIQHGFSQIHSSLRSQQTTLISA